MRNRRVRVLSLLPDLGLGGGENRVLNLARTIDRSRFDLTVATFFSRDPVAEAKWGSLHPEFESAGIDVIDLGLTRPKKRFQSRPLQVVSTLIALVRAAVHLRRFMREREIDVVDAHMDGSLLIAVAAAVAARVPVAVTLYHVQTIPPNPLLQPLRILCLRLIAALITDSQARVRDFKAVRPRIRAPIFHVPNGVRLEPPKTSRQEVLAFFDIPSDANMIIGQVSGLSPFKGHQFLIEAAAQVLAGRTKTYILCAGFSRGFESHIHDLWRQAEKLGIADRVRIASYPGSIADVWQIIDVHVHASTFDSLPNAIIESMSLGKPAVVTSVGGIPDVVENGKTGIVVPPRDSDALAGALIRLLNGPKLAASLGHAASLRYLETLTPECCARAVERCFLEILFQPAEGETALFREPIA